MPALTVDSVREFRKRTLAAVQVVDAAVIFAGSYVAGLNQNAATSTQRGQSVVWTSGRGEIPMGFAEVGKTGDITPTAGTEALTVAVEVAGLVAIGVAVTGVTQIEDQLRRVYLSDDNTFTLTRPTTGICAGYIIRHITGTSCDVYLFSMAELYILALSGAGQYSWCLGLYDVGNLTFSATLATVTDLAAGIEAPHHGAFLNWYGFVIEQIAPSGDDLSLNLEIGGTNVTGGVITWQGTDVAGTKVTDTAITALNIFREGDLIDIEGIGAASGVTVTAGQILLFAEVEGRPGL